MNAQLVLLIKAQAIDSEIQQSEATKKKYHDAITQLGDAAEQKRMCVPKKRKRSRTWKKSTGDWIGF